MATVLLEEVSKRFGKDQKGAQAVDGVDLEVRDGEFMVLLGPSGCGKTTTLRMIAGLETLTSGRIWIDDRRADLVHPSDRDIAMVFQNYALYPHMTVRRNLAYGLLRRGVDKRTVRSEVEQIAATLGLSELLDRKPAQLSGGQRQRVALGRAVIRRPKVFLMDEPLSNLDAKLRAEMRTELVRLQARLGITTIYVTHDQVEAMTMGHRVGVMNRGRIAQLGAPRELFDTPQSRFIGEFLGHPGMNVFEGSVASEDGRFVFSGEGARVALDSSGIVGPAALGIRPQHLRAQTSEPTPAANTEVVGRGRIEFLEHLGTEAFAEVSLGDREVLASVDPDEEVQNGSWVFLEARTDRLHLFDPDGARVAAEGAPARSLAGGDVR